jgi:hypothetical protein
MKRSIDDDISLKTSIITDLLKSGAKPAILSFLSNLDINEIFVMAKLPEMTILRDFLNQSGTFQSLYEARNNPLEKDVVKFIEKLRNPKINYWRIALCAKFATQYFDEGPYSPAVYSLLKDFKFVFENRIQNNFRLHLKVFANPNKFPREPYDKYYTNDLIQYHPRVLEILDKTKNILTHIIKRQCQASASFNNNADDEGFHQIATFKLGYTKDDPVVNIFYENNALLIPHNFINDLGFAKDYEYLQTLKNWEIAALIEDDEYDAVMINYAFNCMFVAVFAYILASRGFLLNVGNLEYEGFGVNYLRNCIQCGQSAKYTCSETRQYFCSVDCQEASSF